MHHNLDDEWLELDRLTQDVARMTDDLAMDLDLDGPEKNVYVVNPSNPIIYSPPAKPAPRYSPPTYKRSPPKLVDPKSPSIISDTPSAADIMKRWHEREKLSKTEMTRTYY